ncbi:patatin [Shinella sp. M27]|uniref:patatin n=1 Tax=Shinella sp. M27 TaxID=3368614 RepID=UPI003B9E2225
MVKRAESDTLAVSAIDLPTFTVDQFTHGAMAECDMIMKGGITSGVVYPYAVLQIATKYRLHSLGGTSAGAIAAAFAAAAEYARLNGRPEGFLTLKTYCDALPDRLLSLFQPSTELVPAVNSFKAAISAGGILPILRQGLWRAALPALGGGAALGLPSFALQSSSYATGLAVVLGAVAGGTFGIYRWGRRVFADPLLDAFKRLPEHHYGFCTGLTQPGNQQPGLTDWIYRALQHIAFGDPDHPVPLTFGDLRGSDPDKVEIDLKVVTTNLSMRRPHTLPRLGVTAAFMPADWEKLFPAPVMRYLYRDGTKKWQRYSGAWLFPSEDRLPVVIAVRMSLSFPLLFSAVPLKIEDTELPSIVNALGGKPYKRIRTVHFSDGGISSNFPIHMFDAPLPTRPTFAFSLEDLLWDADELTSRVALPTTASEGMGVQIKEVKSLTDFAWQILNSAKDWQDQLLSEITGQRERVARIFLTDREGGLNLDMPADVSRQLMRWGYEAGLKFTDGDFDFDEHKWRRLLVLYKHLQQNLEAIDRIWDEGFGDWYDSYLPEVKSYKRLTLADRRQIAADLRELLAARDGEDAGKIANPEEKFPKRAGALKVAPKY